VGKGAWVRSTKHSPITAYLAYKCIHSMTLVDIQFF